MKIDELKARAAQADEARRSLELDAESASPEQRAQLNEQLQAAQEAASTARQAVHSFELGHTQPVAPEAPTQPAELDGFGGADLTREEARGEKPAPEQQAQLKDRDAPRAPLETETLREGYSGPRLNYFAHRQTYVETHTHPDVVEARVIKATTAARDAAKAEKQTEQDKADKKAELADGKDRDRAARIFEGSHDRGLGTADYLKIEADHKAEMANFARNAEALGKPDQAEPADQAQPEQEQQAQDPIPANTERAEYIAERNEKSPVPYREAEAGETIQGKVAGVRNLDGVKHTVIETTSPPPQRVVVEGEIKGAQIGKQVEVSTTPDRRIQEARERDQRERQGNAPSRER